MVNISDIVLQSLLDARKKLYNKYINKEIPKEEYEKQLTNYTQKINNRQQEIIKGLSIAQKPIENADTPAKETKKEEVVVITDPKKVVQSALYAFPEIMKKPNKEEIKKMEEVKTGKLKREYSTIQLILKALANTANATKDDVVKEVMANPNRTDLVEAEVRKALRALLYMLKALKKIKLMDDNLHITIEQ